ncbi:MAG TPA: phosphatidate cytidylyltransferase [Candidatus Acidoferrales bacterium]|nr:phosphatidate cytidylyltransferase [Candidatus Acidoferrales bacterium]
MIAEVFWFCLAAFAFGGAGTYVAGRKAEPRRRRERWLKFAIYFLVMNSVLLLAALGRAGFSCFAVLLLAIGAHELSTVLAGAHELGTGARAAIWAAYGCFGSGLFLFSFFSATRRIQFVYLVVAVFDGFSQVCGHLFGKHRLAPSISPHKTVEGAIGGILAAAVTAEVLRGLLNSGPGPALAVSGVLVTAAWAGDLSGSWIKRRGGVKDFGRLLPGHGGVLDRFGSFVFAAPVALTLFSGWF